MNLPTPPDGDLPKYFGAYPAIVTDPEILKGSAGSRCDSPGSAAWTGTRGHGRRSARPTRTPARDR
jgi:hypothetical protein